MLGLAPGIEPDGVVHHTVMADGAYMNGWCLLVAIDGEDGEMLAWQWCDRESAAAYKALFEQIAPPDVLICDGMKGIGKACAEAWPGTRIQRCLIHVQRDTRADLTSRPRLEAGRELKRLADAPARIHDPEHAARWGEAPDAWCFASMSFQQAHQYFSAVWADGFPRSRHHAVSDVR